MSSPSPALAIAMVCGCGAADTVRLAVAGEIDVSNASRLRAEVQEAFDAGEAAAFELDLAGVPMLDSTGVGTLVACRAAAHRVGLRFAVVETRPVVTGSCRWSA